RSSRTVGSNANLREDWTRCTCARCLPSRLPPPVSRSSRKIPNSRPPDYLKTRPFRDDKEAVELTAISLQGLTRAQASFERSSCRLASIGSSTPEGAPVDAVDLSTAAVDLLAARQDFTLNLKVLETAKQMERKTLNLLE